MKKKLIYILIAFLSYSAFSQNPIIVTDKETGKELELIVDHFPEPLFFEKNSYKYHNIKFLQKLGSALIESDIAKIMLIGHCTVLELKLNPSISKNRAKEIKKRLVELGYQESRIEIRDEKTSQPKDSNAESDQNRRVDWMIIQE